MIRHDSVDAERRRMRNLFVASRDARIDRDDQRDPLAFFGSSILFVFMP